LWPPSRTERVNMGKVVINIEYCKGCGLCTTACAKKLLKMGKEFNKSGYYTVEYYEEEGKCSGCALCAEMCPDVAIEVWK
jgi:2-oxoglutarate ferredoxin oxidoreductase subunit delta